MFLNIGVLYYINYIILCYVIFNMFCYVLCYVILCHIKLDSPQSALTKHLTIGFTGVRGGAFL